MKYGSAYTWWPVKLAARLKPQGRSGATWYMPLRLYEYLLLMKTNCLGPEPALATSTASPLRLPPGAKSVGSGRLREPPNLQSFQVTLPRITQRLESRLVSASEAPWYSE